MSKKIAILGLGEVGSAIKKIAEVSGFDVLIRDISKDDFDNSEVSTLHVCIPQKDEMFVLYIKNVLKDLRTELIIIHSTVAPGTTQKVFEETNILTAHSPIRGDHPDLYHAIKSQFVKYVSGIDKRATDLAAKHLQDMGIEKIRKVKNPINTELGKLVNTFMYAWSIIYCKWVEKLSKDLGADFEMVYTDFIETYNEGYKDTLSHVTQPILKPMKGPIGGHCLMPNSKLLGKFDKYGFTDFVAKEDERYKKEI